jgi:L-lactate dehydrogenase (cytochrome)
LDDSAAKARKHLPRPIFGYIAGAAEDNQSLRDNRDVFNEWGFVTCVLTSMMDVQDFVNLSS